MTTLISPHALAGLLEMDDLLVVDCRFDLADYERGAREFALSHVPRAVHADLNRDLCDLRKKGLGRHPLPDAADFARVLSGWGWTPCTRTVVYDDAGGALAAARLWWMLRLAAGRDVAVLDGGYKAWREAELPLTDIVAPRMPKTIDATFDATQVVYSDELMRTRERILLLDARAAPRFRGENETIDPVAGHIPGARNRPFADNLREGRFKSAEELRAEFIDIMGDTKPEDVVHSCGSGVTACHNLLAMEHAGLHGSRVYAPSWSGWISDPANRIALGP